MHFPSWIEAILLGIVEGLTEFLPISSTGHLLVVESWLKVDSEVFTVVIQVGALVAVGWLFRERIFKMIPMGNKSGGEWKLLLNVVIGFLPVMIVGKLMHHWIKEHLFSVTAIAWASMVGGVVILLIEKYKPRVATHQIEQITPKLALIVGIGQCLALYPGVSRSGATIMTALMLGFSRSVATEFTFLLAIPTLTAAGVYQLWSNRHDLTLSMVGSLTVGFLVSLVVALMVVKWLIHFVQSHTFKGFAWYRIVTGGVLLFLIWKGI